MIGRLNHVAIATADLEKASRLYRDSLGARVSAPTPHAGARRHGRFRRGCRTPRSSCCSRSARASPIAKFLEKNPDGGMHHLCFEVDDILAARDALKATGARVLGDGEPKIGAHGKPVLFLHPKDFGGTLIEIEQA